MVGTSLTERIFSLVQGEELEHVEGESVDSMDMLPSLKLDIIWLGSLILSKYLSSCANSDTKSGTNCGTKRVFTKAGSEIYKPHKNTGLN